MERILIVCFFIITLLVPKSVYAITDPLSVPNNKFGIHINNENDLENARNLVNSNGGDWGYVTVVITEKERNHDRWQNVFNMMRRMHIIPIVRIATTPNDHMWEKPKSEEINNWIAFLNGLNWVTKNRYVVILNEPNLDNEWGGRYNAEEYAIYLRDFSKKLKEASPDFFVLPAGLAPEKNEFKYLNDMMSKVPDVFDNIDGWTSHSYPHVSVTLYKKELATIKKDLPVFITETGWSVRDYSETEVSDRYKNAYAHIWNDPKVVAVTPFILNYPSVPFAQYSWQKEDGSFYKFYDEVASIPKTKGEPKQIESGEVVFAGIQPIMLSNNDFVGAILAKNTGQNIWSNQNILIGDSNGDLKLKGVYMNELEPMRLGLIYFKMEGVDKEGFYKNSLFLTNSKNERVSSNFSVEALVVNLGNVQFSDIFSKIFGLSHFLEKMW